MAEKLRLILTWADIAETEGTCSQGTRGGHRFSVRFDALASARACIVTTMTLCLALVCEENHNDRT